MSICCVYGDDANEYARLQLDVERVRAAAIAVRSSHDLHEVVGVMHGEWMRLGIDLLRRTEAQLSKGDYLVMYSDGIPETVNPDEPGGSSS